MKYNIQVKEASTIVQLHGGGVIPSKISTSKKASNLKNNHFAENRKAITLPNENYLILLLFNNLVITMSKVNLPNIIITKL